MLYKTSTITKVKNNKAFILFLISQTLLSFGEAFYFIAIASLLIKLTGFGTSASFIVICTPLTSLFLSPFAGSLGDRLNEKYLLILISALKALITLIHVSNQNIVITYVVMLLLASLEIIYNPPKKKMIAILLKDKDIMIGNSILIGISGFTFILGPIVAGIIIELLGIHIIFITNSLLYFLSALSMLFIKNKNFKTNGLSKSKGIVNNINSNIKSGINYFKSRVLIKKVILISTISGMLVSVINTAFYSFAFDTLKVNTSIWGIMMSIFYGSNLVAMFISIHFNKLIQKMDLLFVYISLTIVSCVWLCYSFTMNLYLILFLQLTEGLLLSLITIFLNTKLQIITKKEFIARIVSINDTINNIGKLFSISLTYFVLKLYSAKLVFLLSFISLSICIIIMICYNPKKSNTMF